MVAAARSVERAPQEARVVARTVVRPRSAAAATRAVERILPVARAARIVRRVTRSAAGSVRSRIRELAAVSTTAPRVRNLQRMRSGRATAQSAISPARRGSRSLGRHAFLPMLALRMVARSARPAIRPTQGRRSCAFSSAGSPASPACACPVSTAACAAADQRFANGVRPAYTCASPSSSEMRSNWLYFATRSLRLRLPVLI